MALGLFVDEGAAPRSSTLTTSGFAPPPAVQGGLLSGITNSTNTTYVPYTPPSSGGGGPSFSPIGSAPHFSTAAAPSFSALPGLSDVHAAALSGVASHYIPGGLPQEVAGATGGTRAAALRALPAPSVDPLRAFGRTPVTFQSLIRSKRRSALQLPPDDQQELANEAAGLGVAPPATSIGGYAPVTQDQVGNALAGSGLDNDSAQRIFNLLYPQSDTSDTTTTTTTNNNSGGGPPSLMGDPGYMQALADEQNQLAQLDAAERAAEERAIVDFGDPSIAQALGLTGLDPLTGQLAQQNMDAGNAVLARINHSNDLAKQAIINRLAGNGMLFSGETGYEEGEQGRAFGNQQYDARQKLMDYMTQLQQSYNDRRMALRQMVQAALQNAYYNALQNGGSTGGSTGGLENPNQFHVPGDVTSAANNYAASHAGYSPHMVMQEGTVTYNENGQPGVMIKYSTPAGDSTEWTPI